MDFLGENVFTSAEPFIFPSRFRILENLLYAGLCSFSLKSASVKVILILLLLPNALVSATLLLNATRQLRVGTVKSLDILQANAPMIQCAICVVRWVTWLVIARTHLFHPMMQGSATTATNQVTLQWLAPMRRHATTAGNLVTLLATAPTTLSATSATYQVTWLVTAPSQAWDRTWEEALSVTLSAVIVGSRDMSAASVCPLSSAVIVAERVTKLMSALPP